LPFQHADFPFYTERRAQEALRVLLKDPRFDSSRDKDLARLVTVVRDNTGRFADERGQLRATIAGAIRADELREFMSGDDERREFFKAKKPQGLVAHRIPLETDDDELLTNTMTRTYQIRCRIVHTKTGDADGELLLPSSSEVAGMRHDIALVEFLARRVLIANSHPLK
jgi:hypothetical protein